MKNYKMPAFDSSMFSPPDMNLTDGTVSAYCIV